ncbi:hypothetical protein GOP47_0009989 [Adiantum capillus-veneris]|uniref:Uncharacterized protein n=1 Tax=Adiantum capillus-veneris TaxID=13818 RepID=A0A9D4UXN3_ADICA|nr:hypothetical protein GOP47_0009989 [Adiantum capillus-veneris]
MNAFRHQQRPNSIAEILPFPGFINRQPKIQDHHCTYQRNLSPKALMMQEKETCQFFHGQSYHQCRSLKKLGILWLSDSRNIVSPLAVIFNVNIYLHILPYNLLSNESIHFTPAFEMLFKITTSQ